VAGCHRQKAGGGDRKKTNTDPPLPLAIDFRGGGKKKSWGWGGGLGEPGKLYKGGEPKPHSRSRKRLPTLRERNPEWGPGQNAAACAGEEASEKRRIFKGPRNSERRWRKMGERRPTHRFAERRKGGREGAKATGGFTKVAAGKGPPKGAALFRGQTMGGGI